MDYQVDHSSFTAVPGVMLGYAHLVASGGGSKPWKDQFYFVSGSVDAVPALRRWEDSRSLSAVASNPLDGRNWTKSFSAPSIKKGKSRSTQNEEKIRLVNERLEYIYCNDAAASIDASQSRVALRGVVESVEDLVDSGDYLSLDSLLAGVDPKALRPITNVAFLRTSYQVKEKLSNWKSLYQVVYAHLANTGENPARALRGLSASRVSNFA